MVPYYYYYYYYLGATLYIVTLTTGGRSSGAVLLVVCVYAAACVGWLLGALLWNRFFTCVEASCRSCLLCWDGRTEQPTSPPYHRVLLRVLLPVRLLLRLSDRVDVSPRVCLVTDLWSTLADTHVVAWLILDVVRNQSAQSHAHRRNPQRHVEIDVAGSTNDRLRDKQFWRQAEWTDVSARCAVGHRVCSTSP